MTLLPGAPEAQPSSGIARRTGPRASPVPQGTPPARIRPSADKSTVVHVEESCSMSTCQSETNLGAICWRQMVVAAMAGSGLRAAGADRAMQDARGDVRVELSRTATPSCTSSVAAAAARGEHHLRGAGRRSRRAQWSRSAMAALLLP